MKRMLLHIFFALVILVCFLPNQDLYATLTVLNNQIVWDSVHNLSWYRDLSYFSNKLYDTQISEIGSLGNYGGLSGWHMASNTEINNLWLNSTSDITSSFIQAGSSGWLGRFEEIAQIGSHYTAIIDENKNRASIPGMAVNDGSTYISIGAWVVTNQVPSGSGVIPEPGTLFLLSLGLISLLALKRRCKFNNFDQ